MPEARLRDQLKKLHGELEQADSVDADARGLLGEIAKDIDALLERSGERSSDEHESLLDRLGELKRGFEVSHPALAATVGRVADALSNLGI